MNCNKIKLTSLITKIISKYDDQIIIDEKLFENIKNQTEKNLAEIKEIYKQLNNYLENKKTLEVENINEILDILFSFRVKKIQYLNLKLLIIYESRYVISVTTNKLNFEIKNNYSEFFTDGTIASHNVDLLKVFDIDIILKKIIKYNLTNLLYIGQNDIGVQLKIKTKLLNIYSNKNSD